ncbi:hypothetical protein HWV62_26887 [Athelia sp. TMB]|nr:hypothetical protein HWV62_26887 [Athelia sp. TMB]
MLAEYALSSRTSEHVEEEDEEQAEQQQEADEIDEERRRRRSELGRPTISALPSNVTTLETLVKNSQQAPPPVVEALPPPPPLLPASESLTQMLAEWKKTVEGQWSSVREEWATERERLASAREEWESKVKSVESNLGSTATKFDAGLATLALLQRQQGTTSGFGLIGGDGPKGFQHSGGLVAPPSPRSLSADSDRPRHRRKRTNSNMRGRSHSHDAEPIAVEEHDEPTRPYTPSLPDDSSDCEPIRQGSIDSEHGKDDAAALKQLETPESSVHRAPITSKAAWIAGVDTESIPESRYMSHPRASAGVLILCVATAVVLWRVKPE